jgi:hypothetical protein
LLGRHWSTWLFAGVGTLGGASGLLIYSIIILTMHTPVKFFWDGLSWAIFGIVLALTILTVSLSGQSHESHYH